MPLEIEKKFLVTNDSWKENTPAKIYYQGYISSGTGTTVRVRIAGETGYLTIKGEHQGISRLEFEYAIPLEDARVLLDQICEKPIIHKKRYRKEYAGFIWEIDEFFGENEGLVLAEIELAEENQLFAKPDWIGKEVSNDGRYYNASLRLNPYKKWKDSCH